LEKRPFISVIVPVYNGGKFLAVCLGALRASSYPYYEVIVVDDRSTDNSAEISRTLGVKVLTMPKQSGPAGARNHRSVKQKAKYCFLLMMT
jgi:glycosyltransferase involved in cell wall biosynthesis